MRRDKKAGIMAVLLLIITMLSSEYIYGSPDDNSSSYEAVTGESEAFATEAQNIQ